MLSIPRYKVIQEELLIFVFYLNDHLTSSCKCCQPAFFYERVGVTAGSDGHSLTRLTHSAPESLMGALLQILAGPTPKISSQTAAVVRTQNQDSIHLSTWLFIFRGIRGNTRQGLSDPNSRTSLLFYTQASSQLCLILSNCFLSCLLE